MVPGSRHGLAHPLRDILCLYSSVCACVFTHDHPTVPRVSHVHTDTSHGCESTAKTPWVLTAGGSTSGQNGCHGGMFDFMCQLGWAAVPRYSVNHSGCVCEGVFFFFYEINIQIGGLWVKPVALHHVGGPHPISGQPE